MTSPKPGLVDASTARVAEVLRKRAANIRGEWTDGQLSQMRVSALDLEWLLLAVASELEASGTEKGE